MDSPRGWPASRTSGSAPFQGPPSEFEVARRVLRHLPAPTPMPAEKRADMITIKNVLVATDFSPASETALLYGRALARTFNGTLHAIHVVENLKGRFAYADPAITSF